MCQCVSIYDFHAFVHDDVAIFVCMHAVYDHVCDEVCVTMMVVCMCVYHI